MYRYALVGEKTQAAYVDAKRVLNGLAICAYQSGTGGDPVHAACS